MSILKKCNDYGCIVEVSSVELIRQTLLLALNVNLNNIEEVYSVFGPLCTFWNNHPNVPQELRCAKLFSLNFYECVCDESYEYVWRDLDIWAPSKVNGDPAEGYYTAIFGSQIAVLFMQGETHDRYKSELIAVDGTYYHYIALGIKDNFSYYVDMVKLMQAIPHHFYQSFMHIFHADYDPVVDSLTSLEK